MGSEGNGGAACAVCGGAASVYCPADAAALCAACDAAVHSANPLASRHERVPIAAAEAVSGVYDLFADDDGESRNSSSSCCDGGAGGGGTAERSLLELLSDVDAYVDFMGYGDGGAQLSDGGAAAAWVQPGLTMGRRMSWSPEAVAVPVSVTAMASAAAAEGREARVRRYREKRKNRKFQKTIRYASRKAYAEARPRIRGRFIKRATTATSTTAAAAATGKAASGTIIDATDDVKLWFSFSDASGDRRGGGNGFCMDASTYGVVPSF